EPHVRDAGPDQGDGLRGGVREVDDSSIDEGAAVDDADFDILVAVEIVDAHPGVEGEGAVGGDQLFHVVDFAIGCGTAVIGMAVPTRYSGFAVAGRGNGGSRRGSPRNRRRRGGGGHGGAPR